MYGSFTIRIPHRSRTPPNILTVIVLVVCFPTQTLGFVPPPAPPYVTIDWSNVTHTVSPLVSGCHHDPVSASMHLGLPTCYLGVQRTAVDWG